MINSITAIALNSIRQAIRSRLVISLALVMLVTTIGLPLSIKGDGTFAGKATILLFYTLGLTVTILGASTMWSSCSSISQEVAGQQIQLISVKPVTSFQIWLGKWFGMLLMNAFLLTLAGVTVYALLMLEVRKSNLSDADLKKLQSEVLVGRRVLNPRKEDFRYKAYEAVQKLIANKQAPAEFKNDAAFIKEMENRMKAAACVVAHGRTKAWTFDVPKNFDNDNFVAIRYKFATSSRDLKPAKVRWQAGTAESPDKYSVYAETSLEGSHILYIPADALTPGKPAVISFTNIQRENNGAIVFDQVEGVQIMKHASSFAANYVRSIIVIFFQLALISALALTTSAIFSFPVATFTTCTIIIMSLCVHYFAALVGTDDHMEFHTHEHGHEHEDAGPSRTNIVTTKAIKGLEKYISTSLRYQPLGKLSNGLLVSWTFTLKAALLLGLIYPAAMAAIGNCILRSRELALPGRSRI